MASMTAVINEFKRMKDFQHTSTQDGAKNQCYDTSLAFANFLLAKHNSGTYFTERKSLHSAEIPFIGKMECILLSDRARPFSRLAHPALQCLSKYQLRHEVDHVVVRIALKRKLYMYIDWTARQFNRNAPWPYIVYAKKFPGWKGAEKNFGG